MAHYIRSSITLSPLYFLNKYIKKYEDIFNTVARNKISLSELLSSFPIVSDIFRPDEVAFLRVKDDWYKNLGHSLLNPIRLMSSLLRFLHFCIVAIRPENLWFKIYLLGIESIFIIPIRTFISSIECIVDLALDLLDTLLLDSVRFIYEAVEQYLDFKDEEFVYIPSVEYSGIINIINALTNRPNNHTPLQSNHYTLEIMSHEGKNKYLENKRFYTTMKDREAFLDTGNFSNISENQKQILTSFHSQLNQWPKLRLFGSFAKNNGIPQDIYSVIRQKLVNLSNGEVEIKENETQLLI